MSQETATGASSSPAKTSQTSNGRDTARELAAVPLRLRGKPLDTSRDVARLLRVSHSQMLYTLYKAPDQARYRHFEIPKRTGGTRLISAPNGLLRLMQDRLAPLLAQAYSPHPNAHGFLKGRSIVSNAEVHADQNLVLNVDLADFFPSINFGRVRGLFMAPPFEMGPAAATVVAQICTHRNGLPQGAPTSPVLSNLVAATLDRRLTRLARAGRMKYTRYADDITLSTKQARFPASIAMFDAASPGAGAGGAGASFAVVCGPSLEREIAASGFDVNAKKVRLQTRHVRQAVTGLNVNRFANVERKRIRRIRAMMHAWEKFGLDAAGRAHLSQHGGGGGRSGGNDPGRLFRNAIYGELAFVKMVRGADDDVFLKLMAKLIALDPNPSKFVRQMVFGADDFDIFISHAREDKEAIARPVFEACEKRGLKVFLDEAHIGWGQSFATKINTALGAARTVLAVVSPTSVTKDWPVEEMNTALSLEISGKKQVLALMVGRPDLSRLPLMARKDWFDWTGDPDQVAERLEKVVRPPPPDVPAFDDDNYDDYDEDDEAEMLAPRGPQHPSPSSEPGPWTQRGSPPRRARRRTWWQWFAGR